MPAGTQNVEIRYAALTYISPAMAVYKYRLRGLDTEWATADNSRIARFTKLPPGNYDFQVRPATLAESGTRRVPASILSRNLFSVKREHLWYYVGRWVGS